MHDQPVRNEFEPSGEAVIEEQLSMARLLERISELEEENSNLRRLEETINANNHLFEALLCSIHEGILLLNPRLDILRLIHTMLGYSEKDVLGQSVLAYLHPDDAPRFEQTCASLLSGKAKTGVAETRALGPDGSWAWVEAQMTDLLDDPSVQAIVVNLRRIPGPAI